MICEHCGGTLVEGGETCAQCGMAMTGDAPKTLAKVVPFRPHQKARTHVPRKWPKASRATWWILAIIIVSLLVPYVIPLGR